MRALVLDRAHASALVAIAERYDLEATAAYDTATALSAVRALPPGETFDVSVLSLGRTEAESCWPVLAALSAGHNGASSHAVFPIVLSRTAAYDVRLRLRCFAAGARMVTASVAAVEEAVRQVAQINGSQGAFACPVCRCSGLTAEALALHVAMSHGSEPNVHAACPVCCTTPSLPLPVHLNHEHAPPHLREPPPAPFAAFAWVVCRRADGRFLLVNEPAGICQSGTPGYWLPAGRVDAGESLEEAGMRECIEEAGIRVVLTGVLRFSFGQGGTPRVVLMAAPQDEADVEPKSIPDFESCGALWVDAEDLSALKDADYRSPDPAELFPKIARGELVPLPLQTAAWEDFEALLRRLTRDGLRAGDDSGRQLRAAWDALARQYPTACRTPSAARTTVPLDREAAAAPPESGARAGACRLA